MDTYDDRVEQDARLIILRELAKQIDGQLTELPLKRVLEVWGIRRSREWVRTQMLWLHGMGAVRAAESGTVMIAALRKAGRAHVERYSVIDGVSRPSEED